MATQEGPKPDTKSEGYKKQETNWMYVEAISGGELSVKDAGTLLLPKLTGQTPEEYKAYKGRGAFYNIFSRTILGYIGLILKKEPKVVQESSQLKKLLTTLTLQKESFREVIRLVVQKLLEKGYLGILVDMPPANDSENTATRDPYLSLYNADSILNFRQDEDGNLTMLCLSESISRIDPENEFGTINIDQVRVLKIESVPSEVEGGEGYNQLVVYIYEKIEDARKVKWVLRETIFPSIMGKPMGYIPFVFFGTKSNSPIPDNPPLMDLIFLNIKHWQVTVDYYHALHYCAIPTPWAAGFKSGSKLAIGGQKAWVSDDSQASCGYLEFSGQGVASIETALARLETQMAIMGARILLEEQKQAAETAETWKIRSTGDSASLSIIVNNVEEGMEKVFGFMELWMGKESSEAKAELNKEFVSQKLSAQEVVALVQAWQQNGISMDTLLYNLKVGEVLPPDREIEDEKKLIRIEIDRSFENFPVGEGGGF
jgi:hypothetical protein